MGSRKYLPLKPVEVIRVLKAFGFSQKRTRGDHEQWEGRIDKIRRIVTVQMIRGEYSVTRMKTMIENMGLSAEEFYGKDPNIERRYRGKK